MRIARISAASGALTAIAAYVLSAAIALSAVAGVMSVWKTQGVVVDGLPNGGEALASLASGVTAGALNDDEFLYLVVSTREPASLVSLSTGLIIWIDPSGRRGQTFGLRVPGIEAPTPGAVPAPPTPGAVSGLISTESFDHFDVLGPGRTQRRLVDLTPDLGIALALSFSDAELTYEVKLPLAKTAARPYAVSAELGRTLGLGIATPEAPRNSGQRQRLVGSSGFIGGNPFFGGGFAPYREPDGRPKPLEVWTTLTLAAPARGERAGRPSTGVDSVVCPMTSKPSSWSAARTAANAPRSTSSQTSWARSSRTARCAAVRGRSARGMTRASGGSRSHGVTEQSELLHAAARLQPGGSSS